MIFTDRTHAGKILADIIEKKNYSEPYVVAIPNGGVVVAHPIAKKLGVKLQVFIVRKIPIPGNTEAGFGAVTLYGDVVINDRIVASLGLSKEEVEICVNETKRKLKEREKIYFPFIFKEGKTCILVDDGLASGYTMLACVHSIRKMGAERIIVGVPTASSRAVEMISPYVNELICPDIRHGFMFAVADAYENWYDVDEEEVVAIFTSK